MPVLDGLETTRLIRAMEASSSARRTPIIGVTASVSEQDRAVCLGVGMDSFLAKPIKREHLLRTLADCTFRSGHPPASETRSDRPVLDGWTHRSMPRDDEGRQHGDMNEEDVRG